MLGGEGGGVVEEGERKNVSIERKLRISLVYHFRRYRDCIIRVGALDFRSEGPELGSESGEPDRGGLPQSRN